MGILSSLGMVRGTTRYPGPTVGQPSCMPKPASGVQSGSGPEESQRGQDSNPSKMLPLLECLDNRRILLYFFMLLITRRMCELVLVNGDDTNQQR